jgi:hypothetical protein
VLARDALAAACRSAVLRRPEGDWSKRLEEIARLLPSRKWAIPHIEALPDDPRTTVFLIRMLATANWSGTNSRELWTIVFERLVALRDVRCIAALRELAMTPPWFKAWWANANLTRLRRMTMCHRSARGVVLERSAADAPWRIEQIPDELREIELEILGRLLGSMPRSELARIVLPSGEHPLSALMKRLRGKRSV